MNEYIYIYPVPMEKLGCSHITWPEREFLQTIRGGLWVCTYIYIYKYMNKYMHIYICICKYPVAIEKFGCSHITWPESEFLQINRGG